MNTNSFFDVNKANSLQFQDGKYPSPSNDLISEVQNNRNNPSSIQSDIFKAEDSKKRERSGFRLNANDYLIDINSGGNFIDFNRNKSVPRKAPNHKFGLDNRNSNVPFYHPSRMMSPRNNPPFTNFNPGILCNMNQNFGQNVISPLNNPDFVDKTWNSANKNPTQNLRMKGHWNMNLDPSYKPKRKLVKQNMEIINSDNGASKSQNCISQDRFSKFELKGTVKATNGTQNFINPAIHQKDNSFLLELDKKESFNNNHLLEEERTPVAPILRNFSSHGNNSEKDEKLNDLKREAHLLEKEKEINILVILITLSYYRKIRLKRKNKKFEQDKVEFAQKRYYQKKIMRDQAKNIQNQQQMLMKAQNMDQNHKEIHEKVEREQKQEERKNPKKFVLEDHYLLQINDILPLKIIGQGGSATVFKGIYKEIDVAIKRLNLGSISVGKAKQEFTREVKTLSKIRHPNLVLFIGVARNQNSLCILTEF